MQTKSGGTLAGIVEVLSYAGVCAVLADASGKIEGCTRRFTEMFVDGKSPARLDQIFDNDPRLNDPSQTREISLTLQSSGTAFSARRMPLDSSGTHFAIVFSDPAADGFLPHDGQNTIFNASDDLIFQFNTEGRVYYASGNVERITGYSAQEFISGRLHPLDIVHPDDRAMARKDFDEMFRTHRSSENYEHRFLKKNGEVGYFLKSWYVMSDAKGNFSGIVGLNKDITKEKHLRERLQLFHSAFEHATDAIIITGIDGKILDVNDAFSRIYGYAREEVVGKSTAIVQSKHSTREFYGQMWAALTKDDQWRGEIINRKKDGTEIPIWLNITPIYLGGEKIGYMGIESDMSERKDLEQQIIQTEKLATIGQLAAGIAHEIGTPLNIISGNAEFVLLDLKESDPGYRELQIIIEQTKRMSLLMRQLLDFARPKVLSLQSTDINGLLDDVVNFVKVQFQKGDVEIALRLDRSIPHVYGDPALLYQVFLNVIVNAFQAMNKGGSLEIRTSSPGQKEGNRKVKIEFADTGEGIRPENLERIFTPFFTTKEPGKGTGLGLAVTRRIVHEHNGTIDISSELGKGTTVTIAFGAFLRDRSS